mmetsp:Transcript_36953/g.113862  ORF Transcript_36953/g.113862 Transcript_36953/m.113862 type:complete len:245 (+) Transcript_36953:265-999(+)
MRWRLDHQGQVRLLQPGAEARVQARAQRRLRGMSPEGPGTPTGRLRRAAPLRRGREGARGLVPREPLHLHPRALRVRRRHPGGRRRPQRRRIDGRQRAAHDDRHADQGGAQEAAAAAAGGERAGGGAAEAAAGPGGEPAARGPGRGHQQHQQHHEHHAHPRRPSCEGRGPAGAGQHPPDSRHQALLPLHPGAKDPGAEPPRPADDLRWRRGLLQGGLRRRPALHRLRGGARGAHLPLRPPRCWR